VGILASGGGFAGLLRRVGGADDAGGAAGEEVRGGESPAVPVDRLELPG
jgi:hypothetical protein